MKCLKIHSIYRNHNNGDRNEFYDIKYDHMRQVNKKNYKIKFQIFLENIKAFKWIIKYDLKLIYLNHQLNTATT